MRIRKARLAATLFPWHSDLLDLVNQNALVGRWVAKHRGRIPTFDGLYDFYRYVHGEVCSGGAIDFLEFGVYRGHSIKFWSEMNSDRESRFIGFDSFEGLPEDWPGHHPKGTFDLDGAVPRIDDERVTLVKGWFQNTLPDFLKGFTPRSRLVVHNDSDLYSSTLFTLANLHSFLVPGTVIIFDEYSSATHEFRAFADYRNAFWRKATPLAMTSEYGDQVAFVFD